MLVSFQLKCILAFQWVSISANVKQFHKLCTLYLGIFLSRKTIIFWKDYGIFCLCLPWGSLIEQNDIKNSVRRLLKSFSTFYMKFFVIISRLLKKEYGIPHSFLCNISKELYQDGNRLRGGAVAFKRFFLVAIRSFVMNVVCFLLLGWFFSFFFISFVRWRCKMLTPRSASSKAVIIHAPGYGVGYSWGEKQFEQFSLSHLVRGLFMNSQSYISSSHLKTYSETTGMYLNA